MDTKILKELQKEFDNLAIVARRQSNRDDYDKGFEMAMRLASECIDEYLEKDKSNE